MVILCLLNVVNLSCDVALTADFVVVTCYQDGSLYTGTATYEINRNPNSPPNINDISKSNNVVCVMHIHAHLNNDYHCSVAAGFPLQIPISNFNNGLNNLLVILQLEDGRTQQFPSTFTIGQSRTYVVEM